MSVCNQAPKLHHSHPVLRGHAVRSVDARDAQALTVGAVVALIIKEDHILVRDACFLVYILEMVCLGALVDFCVEPEEQGNGLGTIRVMHQTVRHTLTILRGQREHRVSRRDVKQLHAPESECERQCSVCSERNDWLAHH